MLETYELSTDWLNFGRSQRGKQMSRTSQLTDWLLTITMYIPRNYIEQKAPRPNRIG